MTYHLSDEQEKYFYDTLEELCRQSRLLESHRYMQHGDTSVFRHSVSVAYFSYYLALKMNAPVDIHSLVRGALLHDYFLYDWHEKDASHKWHGFHHAKKACENAARDIPARSCLADMRKALTFFVCHKAKAIADFCKRRQPMQLPAKKCQPVPAFCYFLFHGTS